MVLEAFADLAGQPGGRLARVVRSRSIDNDDLWQLIELVGASRVDDPDLAGVVVQVRNIDAGSEIESTGQTEGPMLSMAEAAPVGILLMNRIERVMYASQVGRALLGFGEVDDATDWRDRVVAVGPRRHRRAGRRRAGRRAAHHDHVPVRAARGHPTCGCGCGSRPTSTPAASRSVSSSPSRT